MRKKNLSVSELMLHVQGALELEAANAVEQGPRATSIVPASR